MRRIVAGVICLLVMGAPHAWSRAGDGSSIGSRGSQTFSLPSPNRTAPYGAQPLQRSLTPSPNFGTQPQPSVGSPVPPPFTPPAQRGSFMQGMLGGFVGAGLLGMLAGGGMFHGVTDLGALFGLILQLTLLYMAFRVVSGLVFSARTAFAGGGSAAPPGPQIMPAPHSIPIGPQDYQAFERTLQGVQHAWSQHDINTMRLLASPEMVSYFGEQMAEQTSRGVRNVVDNVRLEQGDISDAWEEGGREYATVAMRFSMTDITYDGAGRVVQGQPGLRSTATEYWTFMRVPGGRWLLSAIQQAR